MEVDVDGSEGSVGDAVLLFVGESWAEESCGWEKMGC